MWSDPDPDPGGQRPNQPPSVQELTDLKDQNEQQLVLIAQLKEMLRKDQSTVSQEKVEEYVNTLSKAKAKKSRLKREGSSASSSVSTSSNIDASKKERINLLRQQLEENKARLAERGKSQKGIEEMVTQLQAQFKDPHSIVSLNVEPKNLDYNENTPQKDLYNILLTKEKKITELLSKSQKLESTVLDLQENLKEKDSVIDARTKAITLMTDSLSKKGKSTLDALEETKEQMRKMQENFVALEADMKARQLSLLNDLKMKNFEIADLQDVNARLEKEKLEVEKRLFESGRSESPLEVVDTSAMEQLQNENKMLLEKVEQLESQRNDEHSSNLARITQLENQLKEEKQENAQNILKLAELQSDLELLQRTGGGAAGKSVQEENEEIAKLKKQLDESNKNMIKTRATQKGKIKELNKKLDQFKKMSDANALILQLQNEISKLNEKIAELEDEKGNLQLKMVESTSSSKGDADEHLRELDEKLAQVLSELEEKNKVIEILEAEVLSLKADLKQKGEEEVKVSEQVSSEVSSIEYEEQIEKIELQNKKLVEDLELVQTQKDDLLKEIETLKREKQDVIIKLENYIQENMELIDKLEKLSAEKGSSAESIEIVEGLTQQEKLELAAYQKHLNPDQKCPEDDALDPPAELNESVLQLSEDTAELLQRIEMFTQERKEVMLKMEALKEENDLLNIKIKEIENNRDILEETYEQLQNEKEVLLSEKQDLLEKLQNLNSTSQKEDTQSASVLDSELKALQIRCEALLQENDELKCTLKDFDAKIQEKYDLERRLQDVIDNSTNIEDKLNDNLEEINNYQLIIEDNKTELINSSHAINQLQNQLQERENDIQELNMNVKDLNEVITELQEKNANYELMEAELQNLKCALTDQIAQAGDYETEMAQNNETITNLNKELLEMNRRILELQNELELKDNELQKLTKDISNKGEIIRNLQQEIAEKDEKFRTVSEEIRQKYLNLQQQLDNNDDTLQKQLVELTSKNKEQVEKMKKLAANLKKKSQAYQELEAQFTNEKEKWENESKEKDTSIQWSNDRIVALEAELNSIKNQLQVKIEDYASAQAKLVALQEKITELEQNNADQQHVIQDLKHKQEKLQEVSLQQEMSASLHEDFDNSLPKNASEDKINELEMLVETKDMEIAHYQERIEKTEETIRNLLESKSVLEVNIKELTETLDLTSNSFKEKALFQEQLELRLSEVTASHETIMKKQQETQKELEDATKKLQENEDLIKKLKIKLKKAHDKVTELKSSQVNIQELETQNQELRNQIASLETNQRHIQSENESLQRRNMSDYEKIEADYEMQLEELLKAKNDLTVDNEKLQENIKELQEKEQDLVMELAEYKQRLGQIEGNHSREVSKLNEEIAIVKQESEKELQEVKEEMQDSLAKIEILDLQVNDLQEQLSVKEALANDLASGIAEAKEKLYHTQMLQSSANDNLQSAFQNMEKQQQALTTFKNEIKSSIPTFHWPGQENPPTAQLFDSFNPVDSEIEQLKQQLTTSNNQLAAALSDADSLRSELGNLRKEIDALEFAKSSLEASYESSQKLTSSEPVVLQEVSQPSLGEAPTISWSEQDQNQSSEVAKLKQEIAGLEFAKASLEASYESSQKLISNQPAALQEMPQLNQAVTYNLQEELRIANENLHAAQQEANNLRREVAQLNQQIAALEFAKASLEASFESSQKMDNKDLVPVVLEPFVETSLRNPQESVPLFNAFSEPSSSAFESFDAQNSVVEEGREVLLKKIKTLEFLLYNVDKEKEIALDQCTEMVNELTHLIANSSQPTEHRSSDLESQILSQEQVDSSFNKKELKNTEYASVSKQPGVEEVIEPKKAYLCFDNEKGAADDIESQIMSDKDVAEAAGNKKELQKLEFEQVDPCLGQQQQPVVENLAQPRHAYLCYSKDDKPQSLEAFEENDDGWAWGPEEAKLEEEHISSIESTPQVKNLLLEVQQLQETIRVLQVERENHLEEIKQLQIKSGKLIKKYKELKTASSKKQDNDNFFDLNETIQEELKAQIQQLEKKIKEVTAELHKEASEKTNLLKRVDVLTAANDRMTEMKEIQDSEVLRWKRKHQEAVEKLQEYEWGNDGFGDTQKVEKVSLSTEENPDGKIQELESALRDLTTDNEELQALLEEQTKKRAEAEKSKSLGLDQEITQLRLLNEQLKQELDEGKTKNADLESNLATAQQEKDVLEQAILELQQNTLLADLQNELAAVQHQISERDASLQEKELIIADLQSNLEQLANRKVELDEQISKLSLEINAKSENINHLQSLDFELTKLKSQIETMSADIIEKERAVEELNLLVKTLDKEKLDLEDRVAELRKKDEAQWQELQSKTGEVDALQTTVRGLEEKLKETSQVDEDQQRLVDEKAQLLEELALRNTELASLTAEKLSQDDKVNQLQNQLQNKEQEFEERTTALVAELNETWQVQVDQRGADVAESWKMHLESVEKDYAAIQEKFKSDLVEFEEKYNLLVNENNELRRNVDQEIRNEVDKLSALQQQIFNHQQTISSLNVALEEKDKQIQELQNNVANYASLEGELVALKSDNAEKEAKLASINIIIETTQRQFDEKREVVEEIVSVLEKNALSPISYEKQDIINEFQRQLTQSNQNVNDLQGLLSRISGEKDREISGLNQVIEDLEKDLSVIHEKEAEIVRLSTELSHIQREKDNLQQNVDKIARELDGCRVENEKIKREHSNCNLVVEDYKEKVQEYQQSLEEKDWFINDLNKQLQALQDDTRNASNQEVENLTVAVAKAKEEYLDLQTTLSDCQSQLYSATQQLAQKSHELDTANQTLHYYQQTYEEEINKLRAALDQREKEYQNSLEMLKNNQLADIQRHYDELLSNKDIDNQTLQSQVQELSRVNQEYEERVKQELALKQELEQKLYEQSQLVDEDTKQLEELKLIIEDQVARIEELKKELFDKSNQYDSLVAEMDLARPVTRQPLASASTAAADVSQSSRSLDVDLSEPVSRAELDLALYMLHQRDVRCEELTVELTQLLEERDTLQLRLSNAIRENEEIRKKVTDISKSTGDKDTSGASLSKSSAIFLAASGTELGKDPLASEQDLATKLSELRNVGYKRDKTFVDEQEARRMQQMSIMEQHIKEASKLPPEAAAKLVDASYTLSRDVQSPSKVLLNWLWGKNPPKANDS